MDLIDCNGKIWYFKRSDVNSRMGGEAFVRSGSSVQLVHGCHSCH